MSKNRTSTHPVTWWALVGWWWAPACWTCRVMLWLVAWPLGLWRSWRHSQRKTERRTARALARR